MSHCSQSADWLTVPLNFFISFLASLASILVVLWMERQKKATITFKIGETAELLSGDPLRRPPAKWLRIQVHNKTVPRWLSWVYTGDTAVSCRAWFSFYQPDGNRHFKRDMTARWSDTTEPRIVEIPAEGGKAYRIEGYTDEISLPPGEFTNLDVVVRFQGEVECWGWNNESYLKVRNADWSLPSGRFLAKVIVRTGGVDYSDAFLIVNDVPYVDFRLEEIDASLKRALKK